MGKMLGNFEKIQRCEQVGLNKKKTFTVVKLGNGRFKTFSVEAPQEAVTCLIMLAKRRQELNYEEASLGKVCAPLTKPPDL